MNIKSNFIFVLFIIIGVLQIKTNCISDVSHTFTLGQKNLYYKNDSTFQPYNAKYFNLSNEVIYHYLDSSIVIKTFYATSSTTSKQNINIKYNMDNYIIDTSDEVTIDEIYYKNTNDTLLFKEFSCKQYLMYKDTIFNNGFNLKTNNNKMILDLDYLNTSQLKDFWLKFENIDSLKKNIDSTVTVYSQNGQLILDRLLLNYIDSNGIDSNLITLDYIINNDTLMINTTNIDTTKSIATFYKYENKIGLEYYLSGDNYDDKYERVLQKNDKEYFLITSKNIYDDYLPGYTTNSITYDTVRRYKLLGIGKYNTMSNFMKRNVYGYLLSDSSQFEITDIKFSKFSQLTAVGYTSEKIYGKSDTVIKDSSNYNDFIPNKINSFILKFDLSVNLSYANYINFLDAPNIYATGYLNANYTDYIVGYIDSLSTIDSLEIRTNRANLGVSTGFVQVFQHKKSDSKYMLLSSISQNEFTTISDIDVVERNSRLPNLLVTGITNSSGSYFVDNNWNKVNTTNCLFGLEISVSLDSIYNSYKVDGDGNEGMYLNRNNYYKNEAYGTLDESNKVFSILSNSSSFSNLDSNCISNNKNNNKFAPFVCKIDTNKNLTNILFLNNDSNSSYLHFYKSENGFSVLSTSKSNNLYSSLNYLAYKDTIANSNYNHSLVYYIDKSLSLKLINNQYHFLPLYSTYIDGDNGDVQINQSILTNGNLLLIGNTKTKNSFLGEQYYLNGSNSNQYNDGHLLKLYLYNE